MPKINYLKYVRLKKGMLQKELASLLEKSPLTIRDYEKARIRTTSATALKIAEIFNDDHNKFLGYIHKIEITQQEYLLLLPTIPKKRKRQPHSMLWNFLNMKPTPIGLAELHTKIFKRNKYHLP